MHLLEKNVQSHTSSIVMILIASNIWSQLTYRVMIVGNAILSSLLYPGGRRMWSWARGAPAGVTRDVSNISDSASGNLTDVKLFWGRAVWELTPWSLYNEKCFINQKIKTMRRIDYTLYLCPVPSAQNCPREIEPAKREFRDQDSSDVQVQDIKF